MKKMFKKIAEKCNKLAIRTKLIAEQKRAEGYIDSAVKIIIGVVIGGLLLAGLYTLFNSTLIPNMTGEISGMFDYSGT